MPEAYDLKRTVGRHRKHVTYPGLVAGMLRAPVYLFPDQLQLDSDEVQHLACRLLGGPLKLPHPTVMFEVTNRMGPFRAIVAYAEMNGDAVDAYLFLKGRGNGNWTDVLCRATFLPGLVADTETYHTADGATANAAYPQILTGVVWRSVALLANVATVEDAVVPVIQRPKLAKQGVTGWTYRVLSIDPTRVKAAGRAGTGSHASPRWHIRRGHWRTLADGRTVFVRACEVGDPARGGVVKDYRVQQEAVA